MPPLFPVARTPSHLSTFDHIVPDLLFRRPSLVCTPCCLSISCITSVLHVPISQISRNNPRSSLAMSELPQSRSLRPFPTMNGVNPDRATPVSRLTRSSSVSGKVPLRTAIPSDGHPRNWFFPMAGNPRYRNGCSLGRTYSYSNLRWR